MARKQTQSMICDICKKEVGVKQAVDWWEISVHSIKGSNPIDACTDCLGMPLKKSALQRILKTMGLTK